jgi:hypothetical protein
MTRVVLAGVLVAATVGWAAAQEKKPVPKDSVRVSIRGCAKGASFTVGPRSSDEPPTVSVPEGLHLHMNGPKKLMADIKAHEAGMIEITGVAKRDDLVPNQMNLGKGIGISPGPGPSGSSSGAGVPRQSQAQIDLEGWRQIPGDCPRK